MDPVSLSGHSFEALCVPLRRKMYRLAKWLANGNAALAEDIVQDAYIRAVRGWPRWSPTNGSPSSAAARWMQRIINNVHHDEYARARKHKHTRIDSHDLLEALHGDLELTHLSIETAARIEECELLEELSDEVIRVLAYLQPSSRDAVVRYYMWGHSCERIAAESKDAKGRRGIPTATVRTRLLRARARLIPLLKSFAMDNYGIRFQSRRARVGSETQAPEVSQADADRVDRVMRRFHPKPLGGRKRSKYKSGSR